MSQTNLVQCTWRSEDRRSLTHRTIALIVIGMMTAMFEARPSAQATNLLISEFRVRGPNGANDEFIEIYNASNISHTVASSGGTGYGVGASDGVLRCSIPNGTVIPPRGHFLCVNSIGYGLASYPAGVGTTATADATYTTNINDNAGIAIFTTNVAASFALANRIDAVGSTSEANTLYKEGTGYPALTPFSIDYAFHRDLVAGFPKDTNNNAADFLFVDTNGTSAGAGQRLGTPGPENSSSPVQTGSGLYVSLVDPGVAVTTPPNLVRDFTSDPPNNSTFGTIAVRRRITNNTGVTLTRLRLRLSFVQTFPSPSGVADLRPRTSGDVVVGLSGGGTANVLGSTLEQPPSQPNGGGFNSSMGVNLGTLAAGGSINVQVLLGIQQTGSYTISYNLEALPTGGASMMQVAGALEACAGTLTPPAFGFLAPGGSGSIGVSIDGSCMWSVTQTPSFAMVNSGGSGTGNGTTLYTVSPNGRRMRTANFIVANSIQTVVQVGRALSDFEFDGRADPVVYRPGSGQWWINRSLNNFTDSFMVPWGVAAAGDQPAPADYDGDGKVDPTVFRPGASGNSFWFVKQSVTNYTTSFAVHWGTSGDQPVPGYYDADVSADPAVYRPSTHQWLIARSTTGYATSLAFEWGVAGDVPVPADYDGDGRTDIAVYRPSTGQWFIRRSDTEFATYFVVQWGVQAQGDVPMPADYDGDGKADPTVYRPSSGFWFVLRSSSAYIDAFSVQWGVNAEGDQPFPGDFDGDGKADPAVYRPSVGYWFIRRSSSNYTTSTGVQWGDQSLGDVPIREK